MAAPPGVCTRCGPSTAKGSPCSPSTTARIACGSSVMRDRERPTRCPCCHSTKRGGPMHAAERRRRTDPALQPRGKRADQVAQDRRVAEDRRGAKPAADGCGMTILRGALAVALALGLLTAPLAAGAQPSVKVRRIGFLRPGLPPQSWVEALRHGLRDLGYVEGKSIVIEV